MSSTSTNKQPLLVDRPLHTGITLSATAALSNAANFATVVAAGCVQLVDCSANDGAVVDSVSVMANQASLTASSLLLFISSAATTASITAANTLCVANVAIGSAAVGQRTNVPLPPLSVPVPSLASPAATMATYPNETDKKNTGLYIPAGVVLYAGLSTALATPAGASVHVFAQGGFF